MSKNTIVLNNAEEFKKFTEDRVLREFAKMFVGSEEHHLEDMVEALLCIIQDGEYTERK